MSRSIPLQRLWYIHHHLSTLQQSFDPPRNKPFATFPTLPGFTVESVVDVTKQYTREFGEEGMQERRRNMGRVRLWRSW